MAKVNRFYKQPTQRLIDPLSMEEMAYAPTIMRQKHDKVMAAAAENFVLNADTLESDQDAARQVLDPLEDSYQELANDITKNGYSEDKFNKLLNVQANKKRVERDYISKLTARKQGIQDKMQEISEKYKDNIRVRDAKLSQFQRLNREGATIEDGELNIPSTKTPFLAEYMSDKELMEVTGDAITNLKANAASILGDEVANLPNDVMKITQRLRETEGVSEQRITQLLKTAFGKDVLDRFRMDASIEGYGLSSISNSEEDFARDKQGLNQAFKIRQKNLLDAYTMEELNRREAQAKNNGEVYNPTREEVNRIKEQTANSQVYKDVVNNEAAKYQSIIQNNPNQVGKIAVDALASNMMNEYIQGMSNAHTYLKTTREDTRNYKQFRDTSKDSLKDENGLLPTMPGSPYKNGIKSYFQSSIVGSNASLKTKGEAMQKALSDIAKEKGWVKMGDQYFKGRDAYPGAKLKLDDQGNVINSDKFDAISTKEQADLVAERLESYINPETNEEFQKHVANDPRLEKYQEEYGAEKTLKYINNAWNNIGQQTTDNVQLEDSTNDRLKEIYSKSLNNITFHTQEGEVLEAEGLANKLGFDGVFSSGTLEEIKEKGFEIKGVTHLLGKGNMISIGFNAEDGSTVDMFVNPPKEVNQDFGEAGTKSMAIDRALQEMANTGSNYMEVKDFVGKFADTETGKIVPVYYTVTLDYDTGEPIVYGSRDPDVNVGAFIGREDMMPEDQIGIYDYYSIIENEKAKGRNVLTKQYSYQDKGDK